MKKGNEINNKFLINLFNLSSNILRFKKINNINMN